MCSGNLLKNPKTAFSSEKDCSMPVLEGFCGVRREGRCPGLGGGWRRREDVMVSVWGGDTGDDGEFLGAESLNRK